MQRNAFGPICRVATAGPRLLKDPVGRNKAKIATERTAGCNFQDEAGTDIMPLDDSEEPLW